TDEEYRDEHFRTVVPVPEAPTPFRRRGAGCPWHRRRLLRDPLASGVGGARIGFASTSDDTDDAAAHGQCGPRLRPRKRFAVSGRLGMKSLRAALMLSLSLAGGTVAQDDPVRPLLSKDLAGVPGREISMITVEYPPGASSPAHTHHAQAMVY